MKKILPLVLLTVSIPLWAATNHTASVSFTASADSSTTVPGNTQIYWAQGACPTNGGVTGITWTEATGVGLPSYTAANPFVIGLPSAGTYCVYVTATIGGAVSNPSNTAGGTAAPFPPTAVTVVVQ